MQQYPSGYYPAPPPNRPTNWLMVAIIAGVVTLLGVSGIFAFVVTRDKGASTAISTVESPVAQNEPRDATPSTHTVYVSPTVAPTATVASATPTTTTGRWFAQFGAFTQYDNAVAELRRHPGAELLPASTVGLPNNYVVVQRTATESEAAAICARYGPSECYVQRQVD